MIQAIITPKTYSTNMLTKYPNHLFIFGDNMTRLGKGGQAIIRESKNAVGIVTKRFPSNKPSAFIHDDDEDIEIIQYTILVDIEDIKLRAKQHNMGVVFPYGGIGTGRANLSKNAPELFKWLNQELLENFGVKNSSKSSYQDARKAPVL